MSGARFTFAVGLDVAAASWGNGGTFEAMLLTAAWSPSTTLDIYVADISAYELTDASYARQALTNLTRTVTLPGSPLLPGFVSLSCDPFSFGVLAGGEVAAWLAVYALVTDDTDSPLVSAFATYHEADGFTSADYEPPATGMLRLATVCPDDYS